MDEQSRCLSPDEPLWDDPGPKRAAPGYADAVRRPAEPKPSAADPQPEGRRLWRRGNVRVHALLAAGAIVLLLVGFLLGAVVTRDEAPAVARPPPAASGSPVPSGPATTTVRQTAPQACIAAVERADQVISYLITKIRDQRLSRSLQAFVESRRACQQAASR